MEYDMDIHETPPLDPQVSRGLGLWTFSSIVFMDQDDQTKQHTHFQEVEALPNNISNIF